MDAKARDEIYAAVHMAGRELGASIVLFHSLMAERFGLSVTDWRAWDIVVRKGPLTAGEFAYLTGLSPGAVTGLIDRLAEAGAVERVTDASDRRKVLVRATMRPADQQLAGELFAPMLKSVEDLYSDYSEEQLATIADFMTRMCALLRTQSAELHRR